MRRGHREEGGGKHHDRAGSCWGIKPFQTWIPTSHDGKLPLIWGRLRRFEFGTEAVQIEAGEAVQIEMQALVSDRVIRDPSDTHLPATAWPRQMLAAFTARPPRASGGLRVRTSPSSNAGAVPEHNGGHSLGCRVPAYESGVWGRASPDEEITEQVMSQGEG